MYVLPNYEYTVTYINIRTYYYCPLRLIAIMNRIIHVHYYRWGRRVV